MSKKLQSTFTQTLTHALDENDALVTTDENCKQKQKTQGLMATLHSK